MTAPARLTPFIAPPRILPLGERPPAAFATLSFADICRLARLPPRVTSPHALRVALHRGTSNLRHRDLAYVGWGGRPFRRTRREALQLLEILAHGFHDYAAREQVCGRGLYAAARPPGRPARGDRPMTAAERMRRMRARRRRRERATAH